MGFEVPISCCTPLLPFPTLHPLCIPGFNLCCIQWFMCPRRTKSKLLDFLHGVQKVLQAAMAVPLVRPDRCQCSQLLLSSSMPQLHRLHPGQYLPAPVLTWLKLIQALLQGFRGDSSCVHSTWELHQSSCWWAASHPHSTNTALTLMTTWLLSQLPWQEHLAPTGLLKSAKATCLWCPAGWFNALTWGLGCLP